MVWFVVTVARVEFPRNEVLSIYRRPCSLDCSVDDIVRVTVRKVRTILILRQLVAPRTTIRIIPAQSMSNQHQHRYPTT